MPNAEIKMPNGKVAVFSVPEGTSEDQAIQMAKQWWDQQQQSQSVQLPSQSTQPPGQQRAPESDFLDKAVGVGETGLSMITGAAGQLYGTVKGIGEEVYNSATGEGPGFGSGHAEDVAGKAIDEFAYTPRTPEGQRYTRIAGEVLQNAIPLAMIPELQALSLSRGGVHLRDMVRTKRAEKSLAGGNAVGADAIASEQARIQQANDLPVPVNLTKGAASREANQLAFEKEQIKNPLGDPLRERAEQNNLQVLGNLDAIADMTEAQSADFIAAGGVVTKALTKGLNVEKDTVRRAYNRAKNSNEANARVDMDTPVKIGEGESEISTTLIDYVNSRPKIPSADVAWKARSYLKELGIATVDESGTLRPIPGKATVAKMEEFRREMSGAAKFDDATGIREETIIKKLTDAHTEPVAGELYKKARGARRKLSAKYKDRGIVAQLVEVVRGRSDPKVTADKVFSKTILTRDVEEIGHLHKVLTGVGRDGAQAWKELQGSTIRYIKDEATKSMQRDSAGNEIVSPAQLHRAISKLDDKLDIIMGKNKADILRELDEVSINVNTVPPGTLINNSGTSMALMLAIESIASGTMVGIPLPVLTTLKLLSKYTKGRKLKRKISQALNAGSTKK